MPSRTLGVFILFPGKEMGLISGHSAQILCLPDVPLPFPARSDAGNFSRPKTAWSVYLNISQSHNPSRQGADLQQSSIGVDFSSDLRETSDDTNMMQLADQNADYVRTGDDLKLPVHKGLHACSREAENLSAMN